MQFEYGTAPIKYIDNVPSHLAGEWPGIKSCKFHSYKKVIRPRDCGVIFSENEPLSPPKRKLLGPTEPTPEYVFRPCCKMMQHPFNHFDRPEGLRYIPFPTKESVKRPERRHEFPYKRELDRQEIENNKKMTNANMVKNEFKLLSTIGFAKRPYASLTNQQLLGLQFEKDQFGTLRMVNTGSTIHKPFKNIPPKKSRNKSEA